LVSHEEVRTEDIRFTTKSDTLYAIALAWPEDGKLIVRSLASGSREIEAVSLLGYDATLCLADRLLEQWFLNAAS
jgi:hypothetical protein